MANWKKWNEKIAGWVGIVATIGLGGLFISGTFLNTFILSYLPQIVHTVVGYGLVITAIVGIIAKFVR